MNKRSSQEDHFEINSVDERLLDRLVDGSLDLPEQRALLARLDETPDGWRRCALAFLEAQAWRSEFRQMHGENDRFVQSPAPRAEAALVTARRAPTSRAIARLVGVALALCFAFGLGRISRPVGLPKQDEVVRAPDRSPVSETADEPVSKADGPSIVHSDAHEPDPTDNVHVAARLSWQLQDGEKRKVEVPVLEGRGLDMEWVMQQPTAVQESIRKELERRGHKVETQRQLLTVNLKDGRSVVVPIDQVQVKFAKRVFQ